MCNDCLYSFPPKPPTLASDQQHAVPALGVTHVTPALWAPSHAGVTRHKSGRRASHALQVKSSVLAVYACMHGAVRPAMRAASVHALQERWLYARGARSDRATHG